MLLRSRRNAEEEGRLKEENKTGLSRSAGDGKGEISAISALKKEVREIGTARSIEPA
jgi:hypothetical protein